MLCLLILNCIVYKKLRASLVLSSWTASAAEEQPYVARLLRDDSLRSWTLFARNTEVEEAFKADTLDKCLLVELAYVSREFLSIFISA